jgi:hypothetical protein
VKYTLRKAEYNPPYGWYVGTKEDTMMYLRPSLNVLRGTSLPKGTEDRGYWDTEKQANHVRELYTVKVEYENWQRRMNDITEYDNGSIMIEQRVGTIAFKFLGFDFTSNHNRKKVYSFSSDTWNIRKSSLLFKLKMIFNGTMKRIK